MHRYIKWDRQWGLESWYRSNDQLSLPSSKFWAGKAKKQTLGHIASWCVFYKHQMLDHWATISVKGKMRVEHGAGWATGMCSTRCIYTAQRYVPCTPAIAIVGKWLLGWIGFVASGNNLHLSRCGTCVIGCALPAAQSFTPGVCIGQHHNSCLQLRLQTDTLPAPTNVPVPRKSFPAMWRKYCRANQSCNSAT